MARAGPGPSPGEHLPAGSRPGAEAYIFHLTTAEVWRQAQVRGEYRVSTRGRTLDEVGFIHASTAAQVEGVANARFRGARDLVVLVIEVARAQPEIRYEAVGDQWFPHLYGPLNLDAVVAALPLEPDGEGEFRFPENWAPPHSRERPRA